MRSLFMIMMLAAFAASATAFQDVPKVSHGHDDLFFPRKVAAGTLQRANENPQDPKSPVWKTYTPVKFEEQTFWVATAHYGDGIAYMTIAVYAPEKDGTYARCLLADSNAVQSLDVAVGPETGLLRLRGASNDDLKGREVLSCNLRTIGTAFSTGVAR